MERNKINFVTGETYTLAELFSGDRRIIIPDLQRDYCWGDETNKKSSGEIGELVTDFIKNLIEQYNTKEPGTLNLGLFYGYEAPINHIQLCDGQQRLTTLYLLLGMINKRVEKFRQYLISDYEYKHDDKEPYLNYAIRESSLYFLSDLVCKFFISNDDPVCSIEKADWYFNDYKYDPSICSIINALKKIEEILAEKKDEWLISFGDWILNKLTFLYFDMENRKNGEETFVIINTTGEPLSVTQNLKPLIIHADINQETENVASKWEEIETWFWKNRRGENDTADAGFAEFLRWVTIIELKDKLSDSSNVDEKYFIQQILQGKGKYKFPFNEISFNTIHDYWDALSWIMGNNGDDRFFPFQEEILSPSENKNVNGRKYIGQNECFKLLPLLRFVYKNLTSIKADITMQRNAKRIYEFFSNLIGIDNVSKAVNSLIRETLLIVDALTNGDIASILDSENAPESRLLSEEEKYKLNIFKQSENRTDIENAFWEIQKHEIWKGEILPIIRWATNEQGDFQFSRFKQYVNILGKLFPENAEPPKHEERTTLLRRCMIVAQDNYQPVKRGSYVSFGWEWSDWHELLCRESENTKHLLDYIIENETQHEGISLETILDDYIKKYSREKNFIEFAENDYLMSFTKNSRACDMAFGENDWQISVSGKSNKHTSFLSRRNAYILHKFGGNYENNSQNKCPIGYGNWTIWYWGDNFQRNCVVLEHPNKGLKLDISFLSAPNNGGNLRITLKTTDNQNIPISDFPTLGMSDPDVPNVIIKSFDTFDANIIHDVIKEIIYKIEQTII